MRLEQVRPVPPACFEDKGVVCLHEGTQQEGHGEGLADAGRAGHHHIPRRVEGRLPDLSLLPANEEPWVGFFRIQAGVQREDLDTGSFCGHYIGGILFGTVRSRQWLSHAQLVGECRGLGVHDPREAARDGRLHTKLETVDLPTA